MKANAVSPDKIMRLTSAHWALKALAVAVDLSIFTRKQLRVLHAYTEVAEIAFRELLKRVLVGIETKQYTPTPYGELSRRQSAEKIIDRIAQHCVSVDGMSKKKY